MGGVVAANRLRASLPPRHRVVLIDREPQHLFQPSLPWLVVGDREPAGIQRPLTRLGRKGIEVEIGEVTEIDGQSLTVVAGGHPISGDAMVLALGADLAPEAIPGLATAGHNLYTLNGATALRDSLREFRSGRVVLLTAAPAYKCPAAPYEVAMLIEYLVRRRGLRDAVSVDLYAAEPGPLGVAGPSVSAAVRQMVESKGISYHPEHQVASVDPSAHLLHFTNGQTAPFDLLAYVPPHRLPAVVREAGLAGEAGWVTPDRHTLETTVPGVFAIGDVTALPLMMGKPLPKAGVFAHAQAEVVASNLVMEWTGKGRRRSFSGYGECFVETGDGRAGFGAGDFFAEPLPRVAFREPSRWLHWGKVWFEKSWFLRWFS